MVLVLGVRNTQTIKKWHSGANTRKLYLIIILCSDIMATSTRHMREASQSKERKQTHAISRYSWVILGQIMLKSTDQLKHLQLKVSLSGGPNYYHQVTSPFYSEEKVREKKLGARSPWVSGGTIPMCWSILLNLSGSKLNSCKLQLTLAGLAA